ncbi:saccharopine dehydrogenase family protein [Acinetobacter larvae]|uniref:Saccharopine dehydrogenase NADP binding domain-containing protein n=1 Tax=Acinetobacter larvae TaxID=1789224 RepID=A0A1B2M2G0_9GAMM|nr:saccharopine dehydrogenase NADP-binding domain-containing protein [Acinetobacter larvae]AOA59359.1 hypothetical protein BFG52_14000 [Acinetobacter larvae]
MKVLAIGGSGGMGRAAVRAALSFDFIEEIIIAGIDADLGERFAASLNDPRARSIFLDVTDQEQLRYAIAAVDVVLNSAGPFFRFGVPILSAAIAEGKHYCDICDDWQPTVAMLELHEQAKQNNVIAVIGLGASPGIINLLCVKAAQQLDRVDRIISAWKLSGAVNADDGFQTAPVAGSVDAAAVHLMHCLSEKIRIIREGKSIETDALEHSTIDFPEFGLMDVWSLGHPEAITLPRHFTQLQSCYNGMLGIADWVDSLRQAAQAIAAGQISVDDAARKILQQVQQDAPTTQASPVAVKTPGSFAFAAGLKDNKPTRVGAYLKHLPAGGMATLTGIPQALFLPLLQQGHFQHAGVFSPEQVIDPDAFFALFDGFCGSEGAGVTVLTAQDSAAL